jgi:urate oxidase
MEDLKITSQKYGKKRVRVLRIERLGDGTHKIHEVNVSVLLDGDVLEAYYGDDNSQVVATDTIKNTITVLAQKYLTNVIEEFALVLGDHFLSKYPYMNRALVEVAGRTWDRYVRPDGSAHPHAFLGGTITPVAKVDMTRSSLRVESGIRDLLLLKSTASGWVGYPKDEYTTLPETTDRIFSTQVEGVWGYAGRNVDFPKSNAAVIAALLNTFAETYSPSVQNTLYASAKAALEAVPDIVDISFALPNKHYLPVNFEPFGLENKGEIFLPTDEPHGQIEARISRSASS